MHQPALIALTFDDGPDPMLTARVLDRLEHHGIPATFFVQGNKITPESTPVMQRALSLGCEFGNHSWDHPVMSELTPAQVRAQVEPTTKALLDATGRAPALFRAPYLAASVALHGMVGMPFIGGFAANDWEGCNTSARDRAWRVLAQACDGAIILLHDVQPEPHPTPEALDILIPALKDRGFGFLTVSDLFRAKGVTPDPLAPVQWQVVS